MPVVQISRIQHRRGKATDLPQLAAGELGWSIDEQKLYIGNGTMADGAPAVGNTEVLTNSSVTTLSSIINHVYKGYLGSSTNIVTGNGVNVTRTLQAKFDDVASVKDFGAVGDGSTADAVAIQRAIEELYTESDKTDSRSRRILLFPAGQYNINGSLKIPPYAHLVGEGPDKTIIYQTGGNAPVAVTEDNTRTNTTHGNLFNSITASGKPTQIEVEGITFKNGEAYGGFSIDSATKVYFNNCKFEGTYASGGADASTSKGVTVRSTNALPCSNIIFNQCQFTKFARLVDFSYDVTNTRFTNCDFDIGYYGAIIGEQMDGSTAGYTNGPRDVHFSGNSWSNIGQQAIYVKPKVGSNTGVGPRNIISHANWYASTVGNNFEGATTSIREVPVIQFDNDECSSDLDFFERSDLREATLNAAPELQGIGRQTNPVKQITLTDNTSTATTTTLEFPALNSKHIVLNYKIVRSTNSRVGQFVINADTSAVSFDDTYTENASDVGVVLTAVLENKDSTAGNETVTVKYTTTNSGSSATMDVEVSQLV